MSLKKSAIIIIIILLIDQISKTYIKIHFQLGDDVEVSSWFRILFIENDGMAWGTKLSDIISFIDDKSAKLILTLFRIIAVSGIGYWLFNVIKKQKTKTLIFAISLVFAGALGNIIDSVFYGILFGDSYAQVATFLPESGGYAEIFHGKVVDMYLQKTATNLVKYRCILENVTYFSFFDPVFNVADVAISTGIGILILFNKRAFKEPPKKIETPYLESSNNPT